MKKRKRAQAEPRREQAKADARSTAEVDAKASAPEAPAGQQEAAAPADTEAMAPQAPSAQDATAGAASPPAEQTSAEAAPADGPEVLSDGDAPIADRSASADGEAEAAAGEAPSAEAPGSETGAAFAGAAASGEGGEEAPVQPASTAADDDSGWEDAPTRELDVGNMEFAATWTDVHDTLPNVDVDSESAEAASDGEVTAGDEAPEDGEALPADTWRVESILESLLFATDRPLGVTDLKRLLAVKDAKIVTDALGALRDRRADSGIQLISVAGGWQLRTHPANGAWVAKLVAGRPQRLSRAMMETLAIVAYRQPITRPEIDEIRGVDCGPVLRTLLDRNLIRIIGKKEEVGRPMLYGTTPEFLKTFSLRDLTELPTLREFHELGADEKAQVDKKMPRPDGEVGGDAIGAAAEAALRPATVDLPQADPAEEDELFDELDRATAAAARASDAAAPPPEPGPEDEPASASGAGER